MPWLATAHMSISRRSTHFYESCVLCVCCSCCSACCGCCCCCCCVWQLSAVNGIYVGLVKFDDNMEPSSYAELRVISKKGGAAMNVRLFCPFRPCCDALPLTTSTTSCRITSIWKVLQVIYLGASFEARSEREKKRRKTGANIEHRQHTLLLLLNWGHVLRLWANKYKSIPPK